MEPMEGVVGPKQRFALLVDHGRVLLIVASLTPILDLEAVERGDVFVPQWPCVHYVALPLEDWIRIGASHWPALLLRTSRNCSGRWTFLGTGRSNIHAISFGAYPANPQPIAVTSN